MINVRNLLTIFRRELAAYFNSAIAYIFIIVFVLVNGSLFMTQFFIFGRADMRPFFGSLPMILAVFLPAVTMRLWAEDRKGNTLELLLTFPMRTQELVLGKYLASFVFYLAALAATLPIMLMVKVLGNPDIGAMVTGYFGAIMLGAFFLAIGTFISSLARDQIVAFILAMMACFALHLLGTEFFAASLDGWIPGLGSILREFIGSIRHFDSFAKGVIDNQDLAYFLIGIVVFLVLNGFWLEGRMRPKAKTIFTTAVIVSVGIFFMGNWLLAGLPIGRFDLTQGKIYTIAPASKKILLDLKSPVTAKFYVSPVEKMPTGMKTLEQEIVDKLEELTVASKGKFQYKIFHMEAAKVVEGQQNENSLEQQLQQKGIRPFQVQSIQSDEVGLALVYSAISLGYKEKSEEIIPRIFPDNLHELEYLLVSRIYRMMLPEVPKIALVAPFQEKELTPEVKAMIAQLGAADLPESYREDNYELLPMALKYAGYDVSRIQFNEKEPIPDKTKTLVVIEPKELNERQRFEINKFLVSGGSLMLAVQNYIYQYTAATDQLQIDPVEQKPQINSLLFNWGLGVDEQILVDLQHDVVNLAGAAKMGPFDLSVPVKVPIQILVSQSGMNPHISITSHLSPIFYLWGTAITIDQEKVKTANLKVDTLLSSSKESWTVPFRAGTLKPEDLNVVPQSKEGPFPLAVMVQGQFSDAYAGKSAPDWPQTDAAAEKKNVDSKTTITPAPGKLILVGGSSFLQKNLLRSGGHLNFFLNSVDALTLGDELVSIRSKQPIDRTIGRISTAAKVMWKFIVILLVPIAIAVIGSLRVLLRRQSKQQYVKLLSTAE